MPSGINCPVSTLLRGPYFDVRRFLVCLCEYIIPVLKSPCVEHLFVGLCRTHRAGRVATACTSCRETRSLVVRRKVTCWRKVMGKYLNTLFNKTLQSPLNVALKFLSGRWRKEDISSVNVPTSFTGWGRCGREGSAQWKGAYSPSPMPQWVQVQCWHTHRYKLPDLQKGLHWSKGEHREGRLVGLSQSGGWQIGIV